MTAPTLIPLDVLRAHKGSDADLARALGVTRSAVQQARTRHLVPLRKPPSRTVQRAIEREASRRGCTEAEVLADLVVWVADRSPDLA